MPEFDVRTKACTDPQNKPRVYFTCHPADLDVYLNKICNLIFMTQDCAIYFTPDMNQPLDTDNLDLSLGRMNLFVVPVTSKLLNGDCRAMAVDIAYAKAKNIPILPFMMEGGIEAEYKLPFNFGDRQYINPNSTDKSEIVFEQKLKNFLEATLVGDEMARYVRTAFDAYVFLSYRKKDRAYANELMRIIHNIPGCRDIAVWYDEFLTPGENWRESIKRAMQMVRDNGNVFTMVVTPNILEEYVDADGNVRKNYVLETEYPEARKMGMKILPAEVKTTDHEILQTKFEGIPDCILAHDKMLGDMLLDSITKIAVTERKNDHNHNFLIGLAYIDGIDVEVDVERGLKLITDAAEAGLFEAMVTLFNYHLTHYFDRRASEDILKWARRLVEFTTSALGERHPYTLILLDNLASLYGWIIFDCEEEIRLKEKVYQLRLEVLGEGDEDTISSLYKLALAYADKEDFSKALELNNRLYRQIIKHPGKSFIDINEINETIELLSDLMH